MAASFHLDPGEVVQRRINRSIVDLIPVTISAAAIFLVVLAGTYGYARFPEQVPFLTPGIVVAIASVLVGVSVLMLLSAIYVYSHNYLLITNIHLIKVEQNGLFHQDTAQLGLSRVQDVRGERNGIFGIIFNFGKVEVQTAGEQENFIFRTAPNPQTLADQLLQIHEDFLKQFPERELP